MASSSDISPPSPAPGFLSFRMPTFGGLVGNLGWPILLKELRGDFRRSRFFVLHFCCLLFISLGVMVQIWVQSESAGVTSVQLGRDLFDIFSGLQFLVVLLVFPALTSTAFCEEHATRSLDLLITTALRPGEIVLGKFLATSVYCLTTVIATVPLLAISTLFGGVKIEDVAAAYAILIGHTVVISMLGVFFSSWCSTSLWSTLSVYIIVLVYATFLLFYFWFAGDLIASHGEAGDQTIVALLPANIALTGAQLLAGMVLVAGFTFAYLFLLTTNRIRTSTDDRSSGLRILTVLLLLLHLLVIVLQPAPPFTSVLDPVAGIARLDAVLDWRVWSTFVILFFVAMVFTTEPLDLSLRVRRRFARFTGPFTFLRVYAPGAFWGLLFLVCLVAVSTVVLLVDLQTLASTWIDVETPENEVARADWLVSVDRWREIIVTFALYTLAFGALGFCLSAAGFSRGYCLLTVFFIFIIALLLPVIIWLQQWPDSIFSMYYLSPVTLRESLTRNHTGEDGPRFVVLGGIPILQFARLLYPGLAVLLTGLGIVNARRQGRAPWRLGV